MSAFLLPTLREANVFLTFTLKKNSEEMFMLQEFLLHFSTRLLGVQPILTAQLPLLLLFEIWIHAYPTQMHTYHTYILTVLEGTSVVEPLKVQTLDSELLDPDLVSYSWASLAKLLCLPKHWFSHL